MFWRVSISFFLQNISLCKTSWSSFPGLGEIGDKLRFWRSKRRFLRSSKRWVLLHHKVALIMTGWWYFAVTVWYWYSGFCHAWRTNFIARNCTSSILLLSLFVFSPLIISLSWLDDKVWLSIFFIHLTSLRVYFVILQSWNPRKWLKSRLRLIILGENSTIYLNRIHQIWKWRSIFDQRTVAFLKSILSLVRFSTLHPLCFNLFRWTFVSAFWNWSSFERPKFEFSCNVFGRTLKIFILVNLERRSIRNLWVLIKVFCFWPWSLLK